MGLQQVAAARFVNCVCVCVYMCIYIYIVYIYIYIYTHTINITQYFRRLCIPLVSCNIWPVYQPAITGVALCNKKVGRRWAKESRDFPNACCGKSRIPLAGGSRKIRKKTVYSITSCLGACDPIPYVQLPLCTP